MLLTRTDYLWLQVARIRAANGDREGSRRAKRNADISYGRISIYDKFNTVDYPYKQQRGSWIKLGRRMGKHSRKHATEGPCWCEYPHDQGKDKDLEARTTAPGDYAEMISRTGDYTEMISRTEGEPDPLVEEP